MPFNTAFAGRRPDLQGFDREGMTGQARAMSFCLPAPLAGPADNARSGAAFATSGMTEMGDGRIRSIEDYPEGHSGLPPIPQFVVKTREGRLSLVITGPIPPTGRLARGRGTDGVSRKTII
jgi:hypothetical protein